MSKVKVAKTSHDSTTLYWCVNASLDFFVDSKATFRTPLKLGRFSECAAKTTSKGKVVEDYIDFVLIGECIFITPSSWGGVTSV